MPKIRELNILILARFILFANSVAALSCMEYAKIGGSDLLASKVCLGTMTWGQQNTKQEAFDQLNYAFDEHGVNILDTAEMYPVPTKSETQGETDRIIGSWLRTRDRSKVILATKVAGPGITWLPGRNGASSRLTKDQILVSVDESLKRLETDYIDLLQIHWPDRYVPLFGAAPYNRSLEREAVSFEDQLSALSLLVKSGKVRYIGVSNETPLGVMRFCQLAEKYNLPKVISIQNSYSLLVRSDFESGLSEICSPLNENIGLLAYSPLAGGILTGKYAKPDCPQTARLNLFNNYMARYKQSLAQTAVQEYCSLADKYGMTPTELALGWCYNQAHVASTIIGATSLTQLKENLQSFYKRDKVSVEVEEEVNRIYKRFRDPAKI